MCIASYKFASICSDKSRDSGRKLFASPGTTRNIPALFSDWYSFYKNSCSSFWLGLETTLSLIFFLFSPSFYPVVDPLVYNRRISRFFLFGARKSNVPNFLWLDIAWIWWCNPISSWVCYSGRFSNFYWNFSPKKQGCNMGTDLCQASHTIAVFWENFPRTSSYNPWL